MAEAKKATAAAAAAAERPLKMDPPPHYLQDRITMFDRLFAEQQAHIAAKAAENKPITVTFPDGRQVAGVAWKTTPFELALAISKGLADNTVVAKVNGEVWDLDRPFEDDAAVEFLKFEDKEAEAVFWHSSAHVLGEAMEQHYGGCLCYGPPIENGFYYDMHLTPAQLAAGGNVTPDHFPALTKLCEEAAGQKQPFQRLEMAKADLLEMFKYNEFKCRILNERVDTPTTTVYRCGPLIDLCRGPHVRDTGKIKAIHVHKTSSTYWEGNAQAETLTRVYGISFPDKKLLKEWKVLQEEAAKRDHRRIGVQQELFFFHELSPGSCFFLPKGAHIYNSLVTMIKEQYVLRGFSEVVTPNIFNSKLWETSGHWQHYAENMFHINIENETFALKPMNCPGHCLMFAHRVRSYRELPLRFADFGVLHRNEASGALTGLTRVRRFQQDDAHIFCMPSQVEAEIQSCLQFLEHVYGIFGFTFELNLSTRPKDFLGEVATWDKAEGALKKALDLFGHPWKLNPGDGAFYGPKIDITIKDALQRSHQCATIQLDFQLPQRFDLEYNAGAEKTVDGEKARPIIIHRAILGSVERLIAILTESCAGKWPMWLSPRQAQIIPVLPSHNAYALELQSRLHKMGFQVDVDINDGDQLPKKIRNAQLDQYNYMLVVGHAEMEKGTVNVRTRDNRSAGEKTIAEVEAHFRLCMKERREIDFEGTVDNAPAAATTDAADAKAAAARAAQQAKQLARAAENKEKRRLEALARGEVPPADTEEAAADPSSA